MGVLEVHEDGLKMLSSRCHSLADEVRNLSSAPYVSQTLQQATVAAVQLLHSDVGLAGVALAERLQSTAIALSRSGVGFAVDDDRTAASVAALAPPGV